MSSWRSEFDLSSIRAFAKLEREQIEQDIPRLATMLPENRTAVPREALEAVFGDFHSDHSFCAPFHNWPMTLREPTVTGTLAVYLNEGKDQVKSARIEAFLIALRTPKIPKLDTLSNCVVYAEKDRIDLEIWIPCADSP